MEFTENKSIQNKTLSLSAKVHLSDATKENNNPSGRDNPEGFSFYTHSDIIRLASPKAIALYHLIKKYNNSTIYAFNYKKVSKVSGLSYYLAKKCLNELIKADLCFIHNGNLTARGTRKVIPTAYKKGWRKFKVKKTASIQEIENLLYLTLIEEHSIQQDYNRSLKSDIEKTEQPKSGLSVKRTKKLLKLKDRHPGKPYKQIIHTTRNYAKQWNISHATVQAIWKRLEKAKLIKIKPIIDKIAPYTGRIYGNIGFGHAFCHSGYLYLHRGSAISIC